MIIGRADMEIEQEWERAKERLRNNFPFLGERCGMLFAFN
jgi:hypothetical protein